MICAAVALGLAACTDEDYLVYDTSQKDAVFFEYENEKNEVIDSTSFTYNYDIAEYHDIVLPVKLMGMPADHDRAITLEAVAGESDMRAGVHYEIAPAVLPAHEVSTTVRLRLLRGNDPELLSREFHLTVALAENADLRPVGRSTFRVAYSDIRPEKRPEWWSSWDALPVYSYEAAQLFFKYFHELAPKGNKATYDEMVATYGKYFERAKSMRGPLALYDVFLIKYVLMPMYADHANDFEWQDIPTMH